MHEEKPECSLAYVPLFPISRHPRELSVCAPALITRQSFRDVEGGRKKRSCEQSLKTVSRKSFTRGLTYPAPPMVGPEREKERDREREREGGCRVERNNIVPRRDPSGKLPGGAPPAASLETKRKLEETRGDWFHRWLEEAPSRKRSAP